MGRWQEWDETEAAQARAVAEGEERLRQRDEGTVIRFPDRAGQPETPDPVRPPTPIPSGRAPSRTPMTEEEQLSGLRGLRKLLARRLER